MIIYKKKSGFRIFSLGVFLIASFLVLLINALMISKKTEFSTSSIIVLSCITIIFLITVLQFVLSIITRREIIVADNIIIIRKVFFAKKIKINEQSQVLIEGFRHENKTQYEQLIRRLLYSMLNLNTEHSVLVKTNWRTKKVIINVNQNTAVELKSFIDSMIV